MAPVTPSPSLSPPISRLEALDDFIAAECGDEVELIYPTEHLNAIIGVTFEGVDEPHLVLDIDMVLQNSMAVGMSYEEALEHFYFNTVGAAMAYPNKPIYIRRFDYEDEPESAGAAGSAGEEGNPKEGGQEASAQEG